MSGVLALLTGYVLGGAPTADWIARRRGIDLRSQGSGNPGANNAMRLGGRRVAAVILAAEILKGAACVIAGSLVGGEGGMALAGLGAVLGNVLNPYRSLRGGQGLGISAGVLLAAIPVAAATGLIVIAVVVRVVRWSAPATLTALVGILITALWMPAHPWGIAGREWATFLAAGLAITVAPKQLRRLKRFGRPSHPQPV